MLKMCEINDYIYANPELGNEEFKSSYKIDSHFRRTQLTLLKKVF